MRAGRFRGKVGPVQPVPRPSSAAALAALALLLAAALAPAQAQVPPPPPLPIGSVITNGVVMLGVNPNGELNVASAIPSFGSPTGLPPSPGTTVVGLRYVPGDLESTADGCLCEGWGASYGTTSGQANQASGSYGITPVSFDYTLSTARSVVRIGNLRVTHDYHPSLATTSLYEVNVTMENLAATAMANVRYQRSMDWDVEPTPFQEYVTIVAPTPTPTALVMSHDNGFCGGDPLAFCSPMYATGPPTGASFADSGPADHGGTFRFNFGTLPAGDVKVFHIYYGAAESEVGALAALASVGASVYTLGQCSPGLLLGAIAIDNGCDKGLGTPATFMFGFQNITKVTPPPPPPPPVPPPPPPPIPAIPGFTVAMDESGCGPHPVQFADTTKPGTFPIAGWHWDFGDGDVSTDQNPVHTYRHGGTYTVKLTVTDSAGDIRSTTKLLKTIGITECPIDPVDPSGVPRPGAPPRDGVDPALVDKDTDSDLHVDSMDNCVLTTNADQADQDGDGLGDACDPDRDGDFFADPLDNCRDVANAGQSDLDNDSVGDACDLDVDGDGVANAADNCFAAANGSQADGDRDGRGDACDTPALGLAPVLPGPDGVRARSAAGGVASVPGAGTDVGAALAAGLAAAALAGMVILLALRRRD
ncbi:MAG: hypothetical protein QOD77_1642 [Thermoplasmata archaeon]|jgi:hypothetical protein|nr:hypothetical protein [Thermoplasmata archaeon]